MTNYLYQDDIPEKLLDLKGDLAVDSETRGLNIYNRDRLCVVQLSNGDGNAHLVQFKAANYDKAENLRKLLSDEKRQYIFHFARFDVAVMKIFLDVDIQNIFCTKIASKIARTYTDKHGLKDLCKELIGVDISKQQQCSDWSGELNKKQIEYAATDVLHLHKIREKLIEMLALENRLNLAEESFKCLPARVNLDIAGWSEEDIFAH